MPHTEERRRAPRRSCSPGAPLHAACSQREESRVGVSALTDSQVIAALGLTPHPEGGFFSETFRAPAHVEAPFGARRAASTAIYFLLRAGDFSAFHSVRSDEVWHHYLGASIELHTIDPSGHHERIELGPELLHGERPQWVVPAGTLQAARVIGEGFGLCGCTVAPGFDFADFDMPRRADLSARFPALIDVITSFTR
jgi:predicted cupin superfamily sugar epimerase